VFTICLRAPGVFMSEANLLIGFEALTKDIIKARNIFKDNCIIEKASLEDIMVYTVRGNV
jgi:ABC-2 type transport system ATP-binding protein